MENGKEGAKKEEGKKEAARGDYGVLRSDRRKNLRRQLIVLKVKGEDKSGVFFGYAKTLGRGGMFIASVNPRDIGEEFRIAFKLPGPGEETIVKCKCKVVWRREFDPKFKQEPGMGIKFLDLEEEVREKINEWVKKR